MTGRDNVRRRALEERVRLAERDIADLRQQVDEGEIDEATAASLEERYRSELDAARKSLSGLPKPQGKPHGTVAESTVAKTVPLSSQRTPLIIGAGVAAMVLLTVVIVVIATGGDDAPVPTEAAASSEGIPQPGSASVAEMEAAVAAQPENNALRLALAHIYFDSGDYMNAMNHYSTVTGSNPTPEDAATANARIGWMAWVALDDPATALSFLDAAIALDPNYGEAVLWKGVVLLYGMEDGEGAAPLFEQVLEFTDLPEELRPDVENMLEEARGGSQ